MAKETITFSCGHDCVIELFGRTADRKRRAEWMASDICPDCAAKNRREKAKQLAAEADADGLPKLTGTEKQIVWAEQLRADFFEKADKRRAKSIATMNSSREKMSADKIEQYNCFLREWDEGVAYIAAHKVQSSWWIEVRNQDVLKVVMDIVDEMHAAISCYSNEKQDAIAEAILTPDNNTHGGIVEITVDKNCVSAKYPKDDDFRAIIKALKFQWDRDHLRWVREIDLFSGSAEDRAAELSNLLLRNGFAVLCFDENIRKKAVDATYSPECKRWITRLVKGEYKDWFRVSIPDGSQALFDEARRIKGARIFRSAVVIPASRHREAFDFAECNDYRISEGAKALAEEYIAQQANAVNAVIPPKSQTTGNHLNDILHSKDEIHADLVDD